jgi:anti-sigma-K factor RskA
MRGRPQALSARLAADYVNGAVRACSATVNFRAARADERLRGVVDRLQLEDFQTAGDRRQLEHHCFTNASSDERLADGR